MAHALVELDRVVVAIAALKPPPEPQKAPTGGPAPAAGPQAAPAPMDVDMHDLDSEDPDVKMLCAIPG